MEEEGQGIELEWDTFLIIPRASPSGTETLLFFLFVCLFRFLRNEAYLILFFFGHLSFIRHYNQTGVTNIRTNALFQIIFYLTFRMLLQTSSELTVNTILAFTY